MEYLRGCLGCSAVRGKPESIAQGSIQKEESEKSRASVSKLGSDTT